MARSRKTFAGKKPTSPKNRDAHRFCRVHILADVHNGEHHEVNAWIAPRLHLLRDLTYSGCGCCVVIYDFDTMLDIIDTYPADLENTITIDQR